jgi:hypothetical protein
MMTSNFLNGILTNNDMTSTNDGSYINQQWMDITEYDGT